MTDLCIAGLPIRVESADKAYFQTRYADYIRRDNQPPVMEMRTRILDELPPPQGQMLEQVKSVRVLRTTDGRLCRFGQTAEGKVMFAIYCTPDYQDVEIQFCTTWKHPHFTLRELEYMYTGFSFQNRLSVLGGGVLHSSSLAWRGQGVAFSAASGTGKSTHVGLWKERFGDDVQIINDDKPAIRFTEDGPMLCGTPWSGKTAHNCNRMVPLRAIVFIERGQQNRIRRLDVVEGMFHLTSQIVRPYYDADLGVQVVDFTQRVLENVPLYLLSCNISQEAVDTAFNAIFSKGDT